MDIDARRARALHALMIAARRDAQAMRLQHWLGELLCLLGRAGRALDDYDASADLLRQAVRDAAGDAALLENRLLQTRVRLKQHIDALARANAAAAVPIRSDMDENFRPLSPGPRGIKNMINKSSTLDQRKADLPPK